MTIGKWNSICCVVAVLIGSMVLNATVTVGAVPAEKVKVLKAKIKRSTKVADYIRYSFQLGELYRDHKAYRKAIALYRALGKKYSKPGVMCGVYHFWAQSLLSLKKQAAGLAVYHKLRKRFRGCQCKYLANAFVALGRISFDQQHYKEALRFYRKAPRCRENRIAAIAAEYMKGWCFYKLGRYRQAFRSMKRTLREIRKRRHRYKGRQRKKLDEVQREAWPNFVRALSRAGNPRRALRIFRQLAPRKQADKMMEQLASSYRTTKDYRKLVILYKMLSRKNRRSRRQVYYWLEILRASHRIKDASGLLRSLRQLEKVTRATLTRASGDATVMKDIAATQKQLHQFAKFKHTEAQKTGSKRLYRQAEQFFAAYRRLFPKAKDSHLMSFWHGEVLLELRQYKRAAQAYSLSAHAPTASKYKLDATYKAALAYHRLLRNGRSLRYQKPPTRKRVKPKKIPSTYRAFLKAGAFYRTTYPNDKNVPYIAYNMGLVYQKYYAWAKARKEFVFVIKNYPKTKYALPAAYHVVDTLRIRRQWKQLHHWTKVFGAMPLLGRRLFKKQMLRMSRAAQLKSCFVLDVAKQRIKAAQCYQTMARELGNHKDTPIVLYNAHVAYYNAKKMKEAEVVKKEILRRFPHSKPARMLKQRR